MTMDSKYNPEKTCRLCLAQYDKLQILSSTQLVSNKCFTLCEMLMACTAIKISEGDNLPTMVCHSCVNQLHNSFTWKLKWEQADFELRQEQKRKLYNNVNSIPNSSPPSEIRLKNKITILKVTNFENNRTEKSQIISEAQINESSNETNSNEGIIKEENSTQLEMNEVDMEEQTITLDNESIKNDFKEDSPSQDEFTKKIKKCPYCTKVFPATFDIMLHMKSHNAGKKHCCPICNKKFTNSSDLKQHLLTHSGIRPFNCTKCSLQFSTNNSFKMHLQKHNVPTEKFTCDTCKKKFNTLKGLRHHKNIHLNLFYCNICNQKFTNIDDLNTHNKENHGYFCTECNKIFSARKEFEKHCHTHSKRANNYKCDECDKNFAKKVFVRHHKIRHLKSKLFPCNICVKEFFTITKLAEHIKLHSKEELTKHNMDLTFEVVNRPFQCDICSRSFNSQTSLKIHMRTHAGLKPLSCNLCDKEFSCTITLNKHLQTHALEKVNKKE